AFRPPDHLVRLFEVARRLRVERGVFKPFGDERSTLAGCAVDRAVIEIACEAIAANEPQLVRRLAPLQIAIGLVTPSRRYAQQRLGVTRADVQLRLADRLLAGH